MERPTRFEHSRYLGDKRTQLVYDLDTWEDEDVIADIMAAETACQLRARHARRGPQPRVHARQTRHATHAASATVMSMDGM